MTTLKTRARNPRGEGQRLRGDIVRAAAALLEEGEHQAPIVLREVARRVGVSAPSIYAHFADRDAVLLAVVQETCAELKTHLQTASGGPGVGAVARLHAFCAAYRDFALRWPRRYDVLFGGSWNAKTAPPSLEEAVTAASSGMDVFVMLADALRDCVASGDSASTDPLADAAGLGVALHGLAHLRATTQMPWPPGLLERLVTRLARLSPSEGGA